MTYDKQSLFKIIIGISYLFPLLLSRDLCGCSDRHLGYFYLVLLSIFKNLTTDLLHERHVQKMTLYFSKLGQYFQQCQLSSDWLIPLPFSRVSCRCPLLSVPLSPFSPPPTPLPIISLSQSLVTGILLFSPFSIISGIT